MAMVPGAIVCWSRIGLGPPGWPGCIPGCTMPTAMVSRCMGGFEISKRKQDCFYAFRRLLFKVSIELMCQISYMYILLSIIGLTLDKINIIFFKFSVFWYFKCK